MSPNSLYEEIDEVVEDYTPLLKALDLQHLPETKSYIPVKNFRSIFLSRCVIAVSQKKLPQGTDGYFMFLNDKKHNLFILAITVDSRFFESDSGDNPIQRNVVGVHEFVHCVAVMLCLKRLADNPNVLLDRLKEKIEAKVSIYDTFGDLLNSVMTDSCKQSEFPTSTDSHFRIGDEDFKCDYADLYANFLFPYSMFKNAFKGIFGKSAGETDRQKIQENILSEFNQIATNENLPLAFVGQQFSYFLQRFIQENPRGKFLRSM